MASKSKWQPRTGNFYGMAVLPVHLGRTWIEGEMMNNDYGQFRRRGLVVHSKTRELVKVRLDVPDTYFSIPATTTTEHGFVTGKDNEGFSEFEFIPHTTQRVTPAQFRKELRRK